ncbi:MAG TPA: DeoR/GlpR family DNA-binding transcription regulator [Candidatus Limnocylindrales bacterium]
MNGPARTRPPASALERRESIAGLLEDTGRVSVAELAAQFGVTDVSIRRDLSHLEDAGRLRRIHGGALAGSRGRYEHGYALRARENREAKARIGAVAAGLIHAGDVVVFDSGSTVAQVAAHVPGPLRRSSAITIVTNSLQIIDEVGGWDGPHLICLGGLYLPDHQALVGPQTVADMNDLSADLVFIGCDGLTVETGLTTPHVLVAEVGATMAARARRVVVVADGTKIGRRGFTPIVPLNSVDVLITDASANPGELSRTRELGIEVVVT